MKPIPKFINVFTCIFRIFFLHVYPIFPAFLFWSVIPKERFCSSEDRSIEIYLCNKIYNWERWSLSLGQRPLLLSPNEVCEGYVFTGVCLSTGRGGGGRAWQGGMHGTHPPGRYHEIRSMSGRYVSYWNTFLFDKIFARNCMKMKEIGPRGGGAHP